GAAGAAATGSRRMVEWGRLVAVALLAAGLAYFVPRAVQHPAGFQPVRFTVPEPEGVFLTTDGASAKLSPDGRTLAFVAFDSTGIPYIWLRDLESTVARRLVRTETGGFPFFWSPDSRQIAFNVQEKLKKINVTGGNAETVCPIKSLRGGSWNESGVMIVAPYANGAIYRVAAGGGDLAPVTAVDSTRSETAHRFPQFLPDGKHFLFTALPARDGKFDTYVGSLDSPKRRLLLSASTGVTWAPPGHLLYARDDKLVAQGFDAGNLKLRGEPVTLGDVVASTEFSGGPIASASVTGISPDDRRVALRREESAEMSDIWIADLERGVATRFTDEPGTNEEPRWSPDGTRIAYLWSNSSSPRIKVKSLVGESVTTYLDSDPLFKQLLGWTPDGQNVVYARLDPATQWDLWILPMNGSHEPRPYLTTRFTELAGLVSPDGRWISYNSNESGQFEAYVQSFPVPGGKYQVTNGGGGNFGWSRDGKQLYYGLSSDPGNVHAADVQVGTEFRLGPPRQAFSPPKDAREVRRANTDNRRLALLPAGNDPARSLTVILNGLPGAAKL
ncbi:MAG: serine/threonine protein kinase, partial [bacterium]